MQLALAFVLVGVLAVVALELKLVGALEVALVAHFKLMILGDLAEGLLVIESFHIVPYLLTSIHV